MKTFYQSMGLILLLSLITAALMLGGCGSGGGSGDSVFSGSSAADTGSVGVFLADGPSDDYDHFWVWLKTIKIYPEDKKKESITVFKAEDPDGQMIDLLDLRDRELLLGVKKKVRSGRYARIGMEFGRIKPEGPGICAYESIVVNKFIDYRHLFEVKNDVTSAMHLDIDIDKSLNSPDDGHADECEFWPILSMKVTDNHKEQDCPQIVNGIVEEIVPEPDDKLVRLTLDVKEPWYHQNGDENDREEWHQYPSGSIDVLASADTTIIDENGDSINLDELEGREGQKAMARGNLNKDGDLEALQLVFGGMSVFKGIITESLKDSYTIAMPSGSLTVSLGRQSLILTLCDEEWPLGTPVPLFYRARVFGKFGDDNEFLGIATLIRPQTVRGELTEIIVERDDLDDVTGYNLIVETKNGSEEVFLPEEYSDQVYLKPDYQIDIETLQGFVKCESREVEIFTDPAETERLTAARVTVLPEVIIGVVDYTVESKRLIVTEDGETIYVAEDAKIIKLSYCSAEGDDNDHQEEVDFSEIESGDKIKVYGLQECPVDDPDSVFDAYFVIVRPEPPPLPPDPDTVVIRRNKVTIYLPDREYNKNLVIAGNKVVVKGRSGKDCDDQKGWTVIQGKVTVNGNKAEFRNIWFEDDVVIKGNKATFYNVVFGGIVVDDGNKTNFRMTCMDYESD